MNYTIVDDPKGGRGVYLVHPDGRKSWYPTRRTAERRRAALLREIETGDPTVKQVYHITTVRELRRQFWRAHPQASRKRYQCGEHTMYGADTRMAFCDYVDSLSRDRSISPALASRAYLNHR